MLTETIKPALPVVSSAGAGFFLGGRYVGGLAEPTVMMDKPAWITAAQETMWLALAVSIVSVAAWLVLDYREHNDGE